MPTQTAKYRSANAAPRTVYSSTPTPAAPVHTTGFALWAAQPEHSARYADQPRRLRKKWQRLSATIKHEWRHRAAQLNPQRAIAATSSTSLKSNDINPTMATERSDQIVVSECTAANAAAHLLLLGDSMQHIGAQLLQHSSSPACSVGGALSVLLDSFLCAMGPLMTLAREIPGVEENELLDAAISSTLDNIAYIMPGL